VTGGSPSSKASYAEDPFDPVDPASLAYSDRFALMDKSVRNFSILSEKLQSSSLNYVSLLVKCAEEIRLCKLTSLPADLCSLSCIFDQLPHAKRTINILSDAVLQLCSFTNTVFDSVLEKLSSSDDISSVAAYNSFMGFPPPFSGQLPIQLIKFYNNPLLNKLKLIPASIEATMSTFQSLTYRQHAQCSAVDLAQSVQTLAQEIVAFPPAADVTLLGYFTLSNIAQFKRFGPASALFDSIMTVMKLLTGVECGIVEYAETGKTQSCKDVTGEKVVPRAPVKIPHGEDDDDDDYDEEVCGAYPDVPPVDLHKLMPNVFPERTPADDYDIDDYPQAMPRDDNHVSDGEDNNL
jgi:hypothetical protein